MLRTERPDYRRSKEAELLEGLRARDPLALAEAYHRTSPAAHACARRLLGGPRDAEALLTAVYTELWANPPEIARLEGWVRSRCFRLASEHLRERDEPPASPSLALLLPDLPRPEAAPHDPVEQALAALPEADRRAVLLAHDQGMPSAAQDDPGAEAALDRALMALAGSGEGVDDGAGRGCEALTGMADWTLGLLEADRAARVSAEVTDRPPCAARSRALRRGRRRLEGLPPAPDMGQRIMASVLAGTPAAAPGAEAAPAAPAAAADAGAPGISGGGAPPAAPGDEAPPATPGDEAAPTTPGDRAPPAVDVPSAPDDAALGATAARSILDEEPASPSSPPPSTPPQPSPPPSTPPQPSRPPSTPPSPPPGTPSPLSPESLVPFARLPSSLDDEAATPPEPREDELAFLSPERFPPERPDDDAGSDEAATDTDVRPADEDIPTGQDTREDTPTDQDTREHGPTDQGTPDDERTDQRGRDQQEDDVRAAAAEAPEGAPEEPTPPVQQPEGRGEGARAAGPSQLRRQLLNVLAIALVLAAGGALGLLIGFLLVGGR